MQPISTSQDLQFDLKSLFQRQADNAPIIAQTTSRQRLEKIARLKNYLLDDGNFNRLAEAMHKDFRKPPFEVWATEIGVAKSNIEYIAQNLHHWMQDKTADGSIALLGTHSYVRYEPLGVCLIISPWNYPVNLAISALVYGIAAGNCIVLKPSELAAHTAGFIAEMISTLFPPEEIAVVLGDAEVSKALLELPFNHIHFTGSPAVGKYVMGAAAKHLATVTLELGGKSPVIVDETADLATQTEKIVWGKHMNNGQTCIAPDYVVVHESLKDRFITYYKQAVERMYNPSGEGIQQSPHLARVINSRHFSRIRQLVEDAIEKGARVEVGGQFDATDLFIAPTLLSNVSEDMDIMQEEVFGPVLPLVSYKTREEAIQIIRRRPKPLSFYISSRSNDNINYFVGHSSAGTTCINDFMLNFSNQNLPFGGVNNSGIGKSQGHHGFISFSNERSIIRRYGLKKALKVLYPPFNATKMRLLRIFYKMA